MADGKIQTPFSEITSPGGLKCQEFGGQRGFEERQLEVRARKPSSAGAELVVVMPDGRLQAVPEWMTDPCAQNFDIRTSPRFPARVLTDLRAVIDHLLPVSANPEPSEDTASDQNLSGPDK